MVLDTINFPEKNLMAGFTTVRDLASIRNIPAQMKYAIATQKIIGPRIINVGHPISAPKGHGDFFSKLSVEGNEKAREKYQSYYGSLFVKNLADVNTWFQHYFYQRPRWYRSFKSIDQHEDLVPDAVKIMATGGVVSDNPDSHLPQISSDVMREIVKKAQEMSLAFKKPISVTAHAHGLEGIANTVFSGARSVEHATELFLDIDQEEKNKAKRARLRHEVHKTMREKEIYMVPTLLASHTVVDLAKRGKLPKHIAKKSIQIGQKTMANFRAAVAAKIPIAFGSDTGISPHGENWREFLLMVNEGGVTPIEAIHSATVNASKVLGLEKKLGAIKKGYLADIIAIKGRPDKDIKNIQNVHFVMRDGII